MWKHLQAQLKVIMFVHLDLAKGIIACICGSLNGIVEGGLKNLGEYTTLPYRQ
jgi:hypothetical protein